MPKSIDEKKATDLEPYFELLPRHRPFEERVYEGLTEKLFRVLSGAEQNRAGDWTTTNNTHRDPATLAITIAAAEGRDQQVRYYASVDDPARRPFCEAVLNTSSMNIAGLRPVVSGPGDQLGIGSDASPRPPIHAAEYRLDSVHERPTPVALLDNRPDEFEDLWPMERLATAVKQHVPGIALQICLTPILGNYGADFAPDTHMYFDGCQFGITIRALATEPRDGTADPTAPLEAIADTLDLFEPAETEDFEIASHEVVGEADTSGILERFQSGERTITHDADSWATTAHVPDDETMTMYGNVSPVADLLLFPDSDTLGTRASPSMGRRPETTRLPLAGERSVDHPAAGTFIGHRLGTDGTSGQLLRLSKDREADNVWIDGPTPDRRADVCLPFVVSNHRYTVRPEIIVDPTGSLSDRYLQTHYDRYERLESVEYFDLGAGVPRFSGIATHVGGDYSSPPLQTVIEHYFQTVATVGIDLVGASSIEEPQHVADVISSLGALCCDLEPDNQDIDLDRLGDVADRVAAGTVPTDHHAIGSVPAVVQPESDPDTREAIAADIRTIRDGLVANDWVRTFIESVDEDPADRRALGALYNRSSVLVFDLGDQDPATTAGLTRLLLAELELGFQHRHVMKGHEHDSERGLPANLYLGAADQFLEDDIVTRLATETSDDLSMTFLVDSLGPEWASTETLFDRWESGPYSTPGAAMVHTTSADSDRTDGHGLSAQWSAIFPGLDGHSQAVFPCRSPTTVVGDPTAATPPVATSPDFQRARDDSYERNQTYTLPVTDGDDDREDPEDRDNPEADH